MKYLLIISIIVNVILIMKLLAMRISVRELRIDFAERAELRSNTLLGVSSRDKQIRAELIKGTPAPTGGNTDVTITKEQFRKMSFTERNNLYNENPELYKQLRD